jgi:uncharacterized protein (TIGR02145 family)
MSLNNISNPTITLLRNECGAITTLPMNVTCETINPTSFGSSDGEVSVLINGGTPPYVVTWDDGSLTQRLTNLKNGSYTATTVDYYKDYTLVTVCEISTDKDCSFSGSSEIFIPPTPTPTNTPTKTPANTPTPTPTPTPAPFVCPDCIPGELPIGNEIWSQCNATHTTYRDGSTIPQVADATVWSATTIGAWCYYNNDPSTEAVYGKLYNWYAVAGIWNTASLNNPLQRKQFAPTGFRVPTYEEFTGLTSTLNSQVPIGNVGGKMKSTGTIEGRDGCWRTPNGDATNSSGFKAQPSGYRLNGLSVFTDITLSTGWWTATDTNSTLARYVSLNNNDGEVLISVINKRFGWPVRLLNNGITNGTKINIWFDSSGSMNLTLNPLIYMRDNLLKNCIGTIYGYNPSVPGSDAVYNERVSVISMPNERFIQWLGTGTTDPTVTQVLNLTFADESDPYGYGNNTEPYTFNNQVMTTTVSGYTTDITTLRTNFTANPNIRGVVFQVNTLGNTTSLAYPSFTGLTQATFVNTGIYQPPLNLSDLPNNFKYKLGVVAGVSDSISSIEDQAPYYLNQVKDGLNLLGIELPDCE